MRGGKERARFPDSFRDEAPPTTRRFFVSRRNNSYAVSAVQQQRCHSVPGTVMHSEGTPPTVSGERHAWHMTCGRAAREASGGMDVDSEAFQPRPPLFRNLSLIEDSNASLQPRLPYPDPHAPTGVPRAAI